MLGLQGLAYYIRDYDHVTTTVRYYTAGLYNVELFTSIIKGAARPNTLMRLIVNRS